MNENAIITFAIGYQKEDVEVFLESCIQNEVEADIYLFAGENADQLGRDLAQYKNLRILRYSEKLFPKILGRVSRMVPAIGRLYARLIRMLYRKFRFSGLNAFASPLTHFMSKRFFVLSTFIKTHHYKNYLFTDIRDVLFQHDPFGGLLFNEIHSGAEPVVIGEDEMNSKWVSFTLSKESAAPLLKENIVCAGVILGSAWAFRRYLKEFIELTYDSLPTAINKLGADQAIHSYLFHFGMKEVEKVIHSNQNGQIITLHHENTNRYQWLNDQMVHTNGNPISIVHQYDRHTSLNTRFRDIYLYSKKLKLVG